MRDLWMIMLAFGVAGCGGNPIDPDSIPSEELRAVSGRSYLIESLIAERPTSVDGERWVPGFDLDGIESTERPRNGTCEEIPRDGHSSLDPTSAGVDNVLADLLSAIQSITGTPAEDELAALTAAGAARLAFQIEAIPPGSGAYEPELSLWQIEESESIANEGGQLIAGQSLRARLLARWTGRVRISTLVAMGELPGEALALAPVSFLDFDQFQMNALGIDGSSGSARLSGQLGGSFDLEGSIRRTLEAIGDESPGAENLVRQVLAPMADINPSRSDPQSCERISAGFSFEAVPVELVEVP